MKESQKKARMLDKLIEHECIDIWALYMDAILDFDKDTVKEILEWSRKPQDDNLEEKLRIHFIRKLTRVGKNIPRLFDANVVYKIEEDKFCVICQKNIEDAIHHMKNVHNVKYLRGNKTQKKIKL
mgnify:CR=1 FL=1